MANEDDAGQTSDLGGRPSSSVRQDTLADVGSGHKQATLATLVIITHDRPEMRDLAIESVLDSAARYGGEIPVRVIDSSAKARPVPAGVALIYRPDLPRCISKRRLAMELGDTEWVIMLDDDCQVTPGAIGILLERLRSPDLKDVGALFAGTGLGSPRNWIVRTALHSELTQVFQCDAEADVPWGATALSAFRPGAVLAAGGFLAENLPLPVGGEDIDVCLRLRADGWRLLQIPDMLGIHDTRTWDSFGKNARRMRGYGAGETEVVRMFPASARAGYENLPISIALGMICARMAGGRRTRCGAVAVAGVLGWYVGEFTELHEQNPGANAAELAVQVLWSAAHELGRLQTAAARRELRLALRRFNWEQAESVAFSWALPAGVARQLAVNAAVATAVGAVSRLRHREKSTIDPRPGRRCLADVAFTPEGQPPGR
jgi:hypothetical protein